MRPTFPTPEPPPASGRHRPYWLAVLCVSLGYLSYFIGQVVFLICVLPIILILLPFPRVKHRFLAVIAHRYLAFLTRTWFPLLGVYKIMEINGLPAALAQRPAILVANHRGFMDSILMIGLVPRLGVLTKISYGRQIVYRWFVRHFDLVSVDPASLSSVGAAAGKCKSLLADGKSLLVFPEGTRARNGRLQRFNRLAFQLALEARVPVIPVILHSTEPFMSKMPRSTFPPGWNQFRIRFLDPEWPQPEDSAEAMSDRVYRRMADALRPLDAGTRWETGARMHYV